MLWAIASVDLDGPEYSINVGGTVRDNTEAKLKSVKLTTPSVQIEDPFTEKPATAVVKSTNPSKGETVYIIIETLTQE